MNILITGAASGLGWSMVVELSKWHKVVGYNLQDGNDVRNPDPKHATEFVITRLHGHLDVLINNAAINKINWLEDVPHYEYLDVMETNAGGIFNMTRHCLPYLIQSRGTVLNIVSNAAHVPMRCSLAYNASKAAALAMTKQLARELTPRYGITVFSVSPNKMAATGMSKDIDDQVQKVRGWSKEEAAKYQLASLLTGKETPVNLVAEFIGYLLQDKQHHEYLSGCDLPYGA